MKSSSTILKNKYGFEYPFAPDPLTRKAINFLKDGRQLLDIGCGEGADSVFYAKKGFQVTAIDSNKTYLKRFRAFKKDNDLTNITIRCADVLIHHYPLNRYNVVNCLLVGCCMKRSEFEKLLVSVKHTVKPGGIIIMSLRNYLDPEFEDYSSTEKMIEPNTFRKKEDCCKIRYYIEKNRLRDVFKDFKILYYYEGLSPDKYKEVPKHGDSYIICRK
ncbi:MAG TPA: methyltransferase domain-containing protein [Chitinophagaceae bacterium]|nr:methyltransferase domain-containing protein [Chitinophagaceae bacterium]